VRPPRMLLWKKMWNPKWRPRNGCNGALKAKNLITIQVNLVPNCSETWRMQHKFTWIVVIKIFAISPPLQPFLGCHFGFHIFFHNSILGGHTIFILQLGCFWLRSSLLDDFQLNWTVYSMIFNVTELSPWWLNLTELSTG